MKNNLQTTTLGMGCFWGVQDIFDKVKGVKETVVGYMGGKTKSPTYEDVCSGSGHTEVVQIKYDEKEISFEDLIKTFFKSHNSFVRDKEQYKSVIFYHTEKQKEIAEKIKEKDSATEILPVEDFWEAEEYHQHYSKKNKTKTCHG